MASVKLDRINKVYDNGFHAIHDVSVDIEDGEFMVLVGPSGCAKSTMLRMVAGLEDITDGTLSIGDKVVNQLSPKDRGIAMVFQNYALYPHMTVYQNMAFGLETAKKPRAEIDARVREAAELLEISELLDRKPGQMSGGQCQRVAVGRAMVRKPEVFLFDEPLSNLDAKLRVAMRMRITRLHQELRDSGKPATMIYVTHDQVEAMTMGDRVCILNKGRIMQLDRPMNLYHNPKNKFVAEFIGSPAMNVIEGKLKFINGNFLFLKNDCEVLLDDRAQNVLHALNDDGKTIYFGIRPEHIDINKECDDEYKIPVIVEAVERLGSELLYHLRLDSHVLVCKVPFSMTEFKKGQTVHIRFNVDESHIFSNDTDDKANLYFDINKEIIERNQ
ncbi:ABC transporter ATP-binding protein [Vibrio sp. 10N.222.51.C12]|uniref:ABC transporter ATP-binding protein n=1 Tax=unclassified Vibrio TaxID=2614977 RepID=UPI000C85D92F|nr:sn-glycerol-3-phosphate ABC transporter ATP-binding protein UgpC [Vibrio sp. 10N.286.48.B7]PMH82933.1 sugar ABC transporter ATP-binding protein [Vibrio sp. 10N.286.48.B7]